MNDLTGAQPKAFFKAIGERFRQAREAKGVTVEQVQKDTHFHHSVITAIEQGRSDEVLSRTYLKSYLRKYAEYLGLDGEEIAKEYRSFQAQPAAQRIELRAVSKMEESSLPLKEFAISAIAIITVIAALYGLFLVGKGVFSMAQKALGERKHRATVTTVKNTKKAAAAVKTKKTAPVRKQTPQAEEQPASAGVASATIPTTESIQLVIDVSKPVLLMATRDGEILYTNVLRAGTRETINAQDKISLWVGDASAIELTLNGKYLGTPGRGENKNLEITRQGVKITR